MLSVPLAVQCNLDVCVLLTAVPCKLSSTPFMLPVFGNMLGGTALTLTMARGCSEQISGTPVCVFNSTQTVAAIDDSGLATSGQHYFCSVPMSDRAERITFEFRAQLVTAGYGTLSLIDYFYLCKCFQR